jgi:two-component system cell cycle response regulator DivK
MTTNPRPTVLVVDDFAENREMYAEYLEFSGFRSLQAADGLQAVAVARRELPDAILMDLALPRLDGWEATRQLKADPSTCHIPVIALTGHALSTHARRAEEAGCARVLIKPALPDEVVRAVRLLISKNTERADERRSQTSGQGRVR